MKRGAGGETRTLMSVTSPDFESGAYTNFATPAQCGLNGQAILVAAATPRQPRWHCSWLTSACRKKFIKASEKARPGYEKIVCQPKLNVIQLPSRFRLPVPTLQGRPSARGHSF